MGFMMARQSGDWSETLSKEQTALALSRVTAANILPPLTELACGTDLLSYNVTLHDHMDESLVRELAMMLNADWHELGWERVNGSTYLCVIGAGVAGCIDITPNQERIYLRYATSLENELYLAGRAVDLPRSRLFLQTALYERIDSLLIEVRARTWHWIYT
ncbi:MAG: hypothetical protein OIN84_17875 [Candidatus Methanoperedens sp.]|nr:hypothetical protein [Candidatus Methanoperedens sp.]